MATMTTTPATATTDTPTVPVFWWSAKYHRYNVRLPYRVHRAGQRVSVHRRDGAPIPVEITRILYQTDDGATIVAWRELPADTTETPTAIPPERPHGAIKCPHCGMYHDGDAEPSTPATDPLPY